MKTFFQELFQYNQHYNAQLIAVVHENPQQLSQKGIELLHHILNVHRIWNYNIQAGPQPYAPWDTHALPEMQAIDQQNHDDSLRILDTFELSQPIAYTTRSGKAFQHSVRDMLFQIINHSTYHRGQIATEFRQSGLEPLLTDYIFYKMQ
ncbi:MAG: DinB family protein [Saprospiraceae bacterium]